MNKSVKKCQLNRIKIELNFSYFIFLNDTSLADGCMSILLLSLVISYVFICNCDRVAKVRGS